MPLFLSIWGSAALYPNTSGSQRMRLLTPSSVSKNSLPYKNCLTSASPPDRLQSASTHMPPSASQRPSFTACCMRENSSGWSSFTNWYSCAWEDMNLNSGYCCMSLSMVAKVRTALCRVWYRSHSHATSMWVWPMQSATDSGSMSLSLS